MLKPQVMKAEVPKLPAGEFSKEFESFVSMCLHKEPEQRATAEQLLTHPFIRKVSRGCYSCCCEVAWEGRVQLPSSC